MSGFCFLQPLDDVTLVKVGIKHLGIMPQKSLNNDTSLTQGNFELCSIKTAGLVSDILLSRMHRREIQ